MKVPIMQYRVTVDGYPVATFATEPDALQFTGRVTELIAATGATLAGPLGSGPVKSVVDVDSPADVHPDTASLDLAAMAAAFDVTETARLAAEATALKAALDAAADALLDPKPVDAKP